MSTKQQELATKFAKAHESGELLVLPTVWDVWSARQAEAAGFPGLTIGSHPVAEAVGNSDGEGMNFDHYLMVAKHIVNAVDIPVSLDVESGYGMPADELIEKVLATGVVGVNIEDVVHSEGNRVRTREEHADYIRLARETADKAGVDLVINGRTDAVALGTAEFADPMGEAVARMELMVAAGARSVYPVGITTAEDIRTVVAATEVPVNVTVSPTEGTDAGNYAELKELGVRRLTFGPKWQMALEEASQQMLKSWLG
ncbi:MAG: isocitrate lyase/phosphoenolpyruvate mutase family protein [Trueperella sp.]|nr:isocitrate lyase/phosphoenolpyruvate mutase family protein [Trueperella sp.]